MPRRCLIHYDDVVAASFPARPQGTPVPAAVAAAGPARRLRDAAEPVAMHPVWSRRVNEALAGKGLDFLSSYVWGRAAALGDPTAGTAAAAFAWFEPGLVGALVGAGRAALTRDEVLEIRDRETSASLAEALDGEDVSAVAEQLLAVVSGLDAHGRPLFAGLGDRPLPDDAAGRLQRGCELAREYRGDAHAAVVVAAGLSAVEANVLTELWTGMALGSYTATRGWSPEAQAAAVGGLEARGWVAGDALTPAGTAAREDLEAATDLASEHLVAGLGEDLDEVVARLDAWGSLCIQAQAFPADALKRAAG